MMNNFGFHPSKVEDKIYDVMAEYEVGVDRCQAGVVEAVVNFLRENYSHIKYTYWAGSSGFCISFVDDGYPHMITVDLVEEEV